MEIKVHITQVRAASKELHDGKVAASVDRQRASFKMNRPKLAIVGGGPSVLDHLEELRAWDGEIWAINFTGRWLGEQGIASKLYTIDSSIADIQAWPLSAGAMLASCISPGIFDQFPGAECFDLLEDSTETRDGVPGGATSLGRIPVLAMSLGYMDIHLFGCEGSFPEGKTHVDRNEQLEQHHMTIRAGDAEYLSRDDLYMQSCWMASIIKDIPYLIKNRSGGLLQALMDNPSDYVVTKVAPEIEERILKHYREQVGYEARRRVLPSNHLPVGNEMVAGICAW